MLPHDDRSKSPPQAKSILLTAHGKAERAVISPDGKYVVYVLNVSGKKSLRIKQVGAASDREIVSPAEVDYKGLTFSHDGNYLYYVMTEGKSNPLGVLYQIPMLGGTSRKLLEDVDSKISLSPDSKQFTFVREDLDTREYALMVANIDGTEERKLSVRKETDYYSQPAWSPNGNIIACSAGSTVGDREYVVEVTVGSGAEKRIIPQNWWEIVDIAWLTDGSSLILNAREESPESPYQIYKLSYPNGKVSRITNDLDSYLGTSLSSGSGALVTVKAEGHSYIWAGSSEGLSDAKQITSSKYDGCFGLSWASDGKIVYSSNESGNQDIWIMNADGSSKKQLTFDPSSDLYPSASNDGRYVVFTSYRTGAPHIWRINIDGSSPKQLTQSNREAYPQSTVDSKWVIYKNFDLSKETLWKVPIDGGKAIQLSNKHTGAAAISPDGALVACFYRETETKNQGWHAAVLQSEGGNLIKIFNISPTVNLDIGVRWTSDGSALTYIDYNEGVPSIWKQPIDGSPPEKSIDFRSDKIFWFDWSHDGKQLAFAGGSGGRDVVLISNFK